jgi:hypothetical protein
LDAGIALKMMAHVGLRLIAERTRQPPGSRGAYPFCITGSLVGVCT